LTAAAASAAAMTERVISLLDMDCFYCQVEARDDRALVGVPSAVVQYNDWKGGGIIAVNYEARAKGVSRNMRGDEAKKQCPEIILVKVPEQREKADLSKYRDAGKEVIEVLVGFGAVVERASIDEAYIDITAMVEERQRDLDTVGESLLSNTFVVGHDSSEEGRREGVETWLGKNEKEGLSDNTRLAVGASILEDMRRAVYDKTGFSCSAGIAHNKVLAKLSCGLHKPNRQTILPQDKVPALYSKLKIGKVRGFGGKLGVTLMEEFHCESMGDVAELGVARLRERFDEKTARWVHEMAQGLDQDPVKERDLPKSVGCSKNFRGPQMLDTRAAVEHWISQLAEEVCERLEKDRKANNRVARGLHVGIGFEGDQAWSAARSRAGPLASYDAAKICRQAMTLIAKLNESADAEQWRPKVTNLSLSAGKFEGEAAGGQTMSVLECFTRKKDSDAKRPNADDNEVGASDLVPTLEEFDASILEFLPPKIRAKVEERVKMLREESSEGESSAVAAGSSRGNSEQVVGGDPCEKCGKVISPFDLPEHLDYHVAKELQSEMSSTVVRTVAMQPKRKRGDKDPDAAAAPGKRQKNILSFFQRQ